MVKNKQDELVRAYTMLTSLRKNIDRMTTNSILETYAREFHTVLDKLEGVGINVAEYRIPDSEVQPIIVGPRTKRSGEVEIVRYSKEKYVEKSFILMRLDAVLGYFEIITSEKPRKMGYTK